MDFLNELPAWIVFLLGFATCFAVQNFVLPDPWSIWLAQRKNGPSALLPFAVVAVVVGIVNVVAWLYESLIFVWVPVTIAPWLWYAFGFGVIVVIAFFVTRRKSNP